MSALRRLLREAPQIARETREKLRLYERDLETVAALCSGTRRVSDALGQMEASEIALSTVEDGNVRRALGVLRRLCVTQERLCVLHCVGEYKRREREWPQGLSAKCQPVQRAILTDSERLLFSILSVFVLVRQVGSGGDDNKKWMEDRGVERASALDGTISCVSDSFKFFSSNFYNTFKAIEKVREERKYDTLNIYYCLFDEIRLLESLKDLLKEKGTNKHMEQYEISIEVVRYLDIIPKKREQVPCGMSGTGLFVYYDPFTRTTHLVDMIKDSSVVLGCFPTLTMPGFRRRKVFFFSHLSRKIFYCDSEELLEVCEESTEYSSPLHRRFPPCMRMAEDKTGVYGICDTSLAPVNGVVYKASLDNTIDEVDLETMSVREIYHASIQEHICSVLYTTGIRIEGVQCLFSIFSDTSYEGEEPNTSNYGDGMGEVIDAQHDSESFKIFSLDINGKIKLIGTSKNLPTTFFPLINDPGNLGKGVILDDSHNLICRGKNSSESWKRVSHLHSKEISNQQKKIFTSLNRMDSVIRLVNNLFIARNPDTGQWMLIKMNT